MSVCVATFGDPSWTELARSRAIPSAKALDVPVIYAHRATLHEARNAALELVHTEWVCHLDADDELEPGYFDRIAAGTADVRAPSVRYVKPSGIPAHPYMPRVASHVQACTADCLQYGNWLVVGSVASTELLRSVGGWRDFPVYEDWDLWLRCHLAGASIEGIPDAVYRAHVRPDSRNRGPSQALKNEVHRAIHRANLGVPA